MATSTIIRLLPTNGNQLDNHQPSRKPQAAKCSCALHSAFYCEPQHKRGIIRLKAIRSTHTLTCWQLIDVKSFNFLAISIRTYDIPETERRFDASGTAASSARMRPNANATHKWQFRTDPSLANAIESDAPLVVASSGIY